MSKKEKKSKENKEKIKINNPHYVEYILRTGLALFIYNIISSAITLGIAAIIIFGFHLEFGVLGAFLLLLFSLIVSLLISALITTLRLRTSARAITDIRDALNQMTRGNFDINLKITSREEYLTDIAEQINTVAKELSSTTILKQDFIRNFSHEFKTPIAAIKGYSELLLKDKTLSEEDKEKYLHIIMDQADWLSNLANMTLMQSNLESQNIILNKEDVYLDEQIGEAALLLYQQVEYKKISVDINVGHILVNASKDLTKDLWNNLFTNEVKYTGIEGHIRVYTEEWDDEYRVIFADNGIGISEEALPHIFDSYYQEAGNTSNRGIGLGLSICKGICNLHGWTITADSIKNKGSTFIVHIPKSNLD
ncbi:MAG: HAMP domain-containing histidine kinase [Coprobacillus sp.]|nr:HAMP domain-containing histidine kinase [Coprobacillus sp.]